MNEAVKAVQTLDCLGLYCPEPLFRTRDSIDAMQTGVEFYACEASKQVPGWEKVELIPGVKVVGAGTLNDLALDAGAVMWF